MSDKPVIFISYSHKDEPEQPREGEVQWLSFVRTYLQPAIQRGIFDLWVDSQLTWGDHWEQVIEQKLRACDIFILLVSVNSMASHYVVKKEIRIIRERQARGDEVYFCPLLLTPTPDDGLDEVRDKNLRPRGARPLSGFSRHDRQEHMKEAANEIAKIARRIAEHKGARQPTSRPRQPVYVHTTGLPETGYQHLVGRVDELKRLDDAWPDGRVNILSLVAEGGAGKSALVNEWLKRLQAENYRRAEAVLGWSFYSQGTKERATSAEPFLDWALDKLRIKKNDIMSANAKGEAIAEAMMHRRVLLVLDGVEPLQHGLDNQLGQLKDHGLRALLRRFAETPPALAHGLIVLTSRLAVKDIARWQETAAPLVDVGRLSDEAGAALLRDNGVWGTDRELRVATNDFDGHPLALGLLASFLNETQFGDVRRRDHIRELFNDPENPRQDHAKRVMESFEREWLVGQPALQAIMQLVGLFDRPATGDCLLALRRKPVIPGLTDTIIDLHEDEWRRAVVRLRETGLLVPRDPLAPEAIDAHPLVREWFGQRLEKTNAEAWRAAHGRLYEHLRDTTKEGKQPTLESLAPLYQAIAHGCRAGRHREAREKIYRDRICRVGADGKIEFYAITKLGAYDSDLGAISWFFDRPYEAPVATLPPKDQGWVLSLAASWLRSLGRCAEALPALRAALRMNVEAGVWRNAAADATNLSEVELLVGQIPAAVETAQESVAYAKMSDNKFQLLSSLATQANVLHALGQRTSAERLFVAAERLQREIEPNYPLLCFVPGYGYCDLLLARGERAAVRDRARKSLKRAKSEKRLLEIALDTLMLARAHLALALERMAPQRAFMGARAEARTAGRLLDQAVDDLRAAGSWDEVPRGLLARAAFHRSAGNWAGAARDLDEAEEIAAAGPMSLILRDIAIEKTRLALAQIEVFAPLNGFIDNRITRPFVLAAEEVTQLTAEAAQNLAKATERIDSYGYYRRDAELAELRAVLRGERTFASLPPRV